MTDLVKQNGSLDNRFSDDQLQDWLERDKTCALYIKDTHERELYQDYLNFRANGGKVIDFLNSRNLIWAHINDIQLQRRDDLCHLDTLAGKVGQWFRMKLRIDEAHRRAVEGVDEPVYYKGEIVGYQKKYSDAILLKLITADDPDRFTDRKKVTHEGVMLNFHVEGINGFGEAGRNV